MTRQDCGSPHCQDVWCEREQLKQEVEALQTEKKAVGEVLDRIGIEVGHLEKAAAAQAAAIKETIETLDGLEKAFRGYCNEGDGVPEAAGIGSWGWHYDRAVDLLRRRGLRP